MLMVQHNEPVANDVPRALPLAMNDEEHSKNWWKVEVLSRMTNAFMTPYESFQLANHPWTDEQSKANAVKVSTLFGQPRGAGKACKALLKALAHSSPVAKGEVMDVKSFMFPVAKHLMISQFKQLPPLEGQVLSGEGDITKCYCMPSSFFMLHGCVHVTHPPFKNDHPYVIICFQCSKCLRCGGLLVLSLSRFDWVGTTLLLKHVSLMLNVSPGKPVHLAYQGCAKLPRRGALTV